MGISNVMAHWFERLHQRGAFKGLKSIFELGPQDLVLSRPVLANFATSVSGRPHSLVDIEAKFFANGEPRWWTATRDFYALLGLADYHGADIDDQRADYSIDLNYLTRLERRFDVMTNFGTAEHLFNIANAMQLIHDHLEPGGIALHVMPTRGQYNHGFYAINSNFYRNLATFNKYEIVDLVNVPDFGGQHAFLETNEITGEGVPRKSVFVDISRDDDKSREIEFAKVVVERADRSPDVFDYCFAALRKTVDADFVYPQQLYTQASQGAAVGKPRDRTETRFVAQLGAAMAYLHAQRWSEAEARAHGALEVVPDNADALHVLALVFAHTGRGSDAVSTLQRVCEIAPTNAEAVRNLGLVLKAMGRNDDAILRFRQLTALAPSFADGHFQLAATLHQAGELESAANVYRRVVSLEPGHSGAREALAVIASSR